MFDVDGNISIEVQNQEGYQEYYEFFQCDGTYQDLDFETEKEVLDYIEDKILNLLEMEIFKLVSHGGNSSYFPNYDIEIHGYNPRFSIDLDDLNIEKIED